MLNQRYRIYTDTKKEITKVIKKASEVYPVKTKIEKVKHTTNAYLLYVDTNCSIPFNIKLKQLLSYNGNLLVYDNSMNRI